MKEMNLNFLGGLLVLLENKKRLIRHFILIFLIAIGISLLLPKYYKSTAVFLPPDVGSGMGLAALIPNVTVDILGSNEITKRQIMTIIDSREIKEEIVKHFDLVHVYETDNKRDYLESAIKQLEENAMPTMNEEGGLGFADVISFSITVLDKDSNRCAEMANYYVKCIDDKMRSLNSQKPSNSRRFLEKRIEENKQDLEKARAELLAFQLANKLFDIPEQIRFVLKSTGELRSQIIELETQKKLRTLQSSNDEPEIQQLDRQISVLQGKIAEIEKSKNPDLFLGLDRSLDLAYRYADLLVEVETQTGLYTILKQQLEHAKIQEAKDISSIRIIDSANVPQKKFKPKRLFVVLAIVLIYMFLFSVLILLKHNYPVLLSDNPALAGQLDKISTHLRHPFRK